MGMFSDLQKGLTQFQNIATQVQSYIPQKPAAQPVYTPPPQPMAAVAPKDNKMLLIAGGAALLAVIVLVKK